MRKTIHIISAAVLFLTLLFGQDFIPVKSNDILMTQPKPTFSLLDPERFNIQHGFSMSMISAGKHSFSVGSYSNKMTYLLTDKLKLNAGFTYLLPNGPSPMNTFQSFQQQLYYSAELEYKPTENSFFRLGIKNYPSFYNTHSQPLIPSIEP